MLPPDLISGITFWIFKSLWESRDETYEAINHRLKQSIFYASREYQANYISRHGFVKQDDLNLSVELERIYIAPSLIDQAIPIHPLSKKTIPYREIDYLKSLGFLCDGVDLAAKYKHLIIRGQPGIGKTTLLKKIGIEAFNTNNHNLVSGHIPVFIETAKCLDDDFDLEALIAKEFEVCGFPEHQAFVDSALKKGKLLILVDDLDIISIDRRDYIMLKIKDFTDLNKANRMVLAGRKSRRPHPLTHFHTVNLLGFSSTQAQGYINRIHQIKFEEILPPANCQDIWHQISDRNKTTKLIAHNPLYLSIVLSLYQPSKKQVSSRTTLYEKILFNLLNSNGYSCIERNSSQTAEDRLKILSEIAYICLKSGRLHFRKAEIHRLYAAIRNRNQARSDSPDFVLQREEYLANFIVYVDKSFCQFENLLLQKFLTAHYLSENFKALDESIDQFLDIPSWHDVFIFLSGMQGADHLISLLQDGIVNKIKSPHLTHFLTWISQISENVSISPDKAINRCHVTFMIFEIMLLFDDRSTDRTIISNILQQIKEIVSLLDPEYHLQGLKRQQIEPAYHARISHFIDPKLMRGLSIEGLLDLADSLAQRASFHSLIDGHNSKRLSTTIHHLKQHLSGKTISIYHRKVCEGNLYRLWIKSLGITEEDLNFTTQNLQSFSLYCHGIHLIIQCLDEAFYVSGNLHKDAIKAILRPKNQVKQLTASPALPANL
jgi:hypothetical protein